MKYLFGLVIIVTVGVAACSPKINNGVAPGAENRSIALPATLNLLSYNIHHCNPPTAGTLIDVDTIAGVIRKLNPDLVALQEVDVKTKRSGGIDQARLLGEKTGMKAYFFKAIDHDGGEYGVGILSKLPVSDFKQYKLPTVSESKGEPRILATVTITGKDGNDLIFACTHLDAQSNPQNRLLQIREINSILKDNKLPVIIAGDLNAATGSEVINIFDEMFARTCTNCAFTIPVLKPNKTIDFIGYKPTTRFEVEKHEVINETYASDHLPVSVRLKLK
ncbi:endonuclease/exonuclease/phosphatase family protein [Flavitalea sp.]|nr:endonuclease/exonuclease/phosphatase family protein [Flavitalea sp.]